MKYRRLGKSGPQVSTASAGRGSQSGANRVRNLEQNVGAGAGARYPEHVMKGLGL